MKKGTVVFVLCEFSPGGFPCERQFRIRSPRGELHGVAQIQYCYSTDRHPLDDDLGTNKSMDGLVAGVVVGHGTDATTRVYLPDNDVYELEDGAIIQVRDHETRFIQTNSFSG